MRRINVTQLRRMILEEAQDIVASSSPAPKNFVEFRKAMANIMTQARIPDDLIYMVNDISDEDTSFVPLMWNFWHLIEKEYRNCKNEREKLSIFYDYLPEIAEDVISSYLSLYSDDQRPRRSVNAMINRIEHVISGSKRKLSVTSEFGSPSEMFIDDVADEFIRHIKTLTPTFSSAKYELVRQGRNAVDVKMIITVKNVTNYGLMTHILTPIKVVAKKLNFEFIDDGEETEMGSKKVSQKYAVFSAGENPKNVDRKLYVRVEPSRKNLAQITFEFEFEDKI